MFIYLIALVIFRCAHESSESHELVICVCDINMAQSYDVCADAHVCMWYATHCNTLQHIATTAHAATHCNTLQ